MVLIKRMQNFIAMAAGGIVLGACVANPPDRAGNFPAGADVTPSVARADTAPSVNEGIAVLNAVFVGRGCGGKGTVVIGRKIKDGYAAVQKIKSSRRTGDVQRLKLPAGTYHIVGAGCRFQAGGHQYTLSVGKKNATDIFGNDGDYKHSFATFAVASGEVVNAGLLKVRSGALGPSVLAVDDLPQRSIMRFRKAYPALASRMTTRLMTIDRQPIDDKQRQKLCKAIAKLRQVLPQAAKKIPAECRDQQTAAR